MKNQTACLLREGHELFYCDSSIWFKNGKVSENYLDHESMEFITKELSFAEIREILRDNRYQRYVEDDIEWLKGKR